MNSDVTENAALKLVQGLSSCRCCLQRDPDKILNRPYFINNRREIYLDMLKECFDITLNADSESCGICVVCVVRLRDASDFKLLVQRSQAELRERLDRALHLLSEPNVKSETADDGKEYLNYKPDNLPLGDDGEASDISTSSTSMSSCDSDAADVSDLTRQQLAMTCSVILERLCDEHTFHQETNTINMEKDYDSTSENEAFNVHASDDRKSDISNVVEKNSDTIEIDSKNNYLPKNLNEPKRTRRHITDKQEAYICDICNARFSCKYNIILHFRLHTAQTPCNVHNERFSDKSQRKNHRSVHKKRKSVNIKSKTMYICDICNRKFSRRSSMVRHILIHTDRKQYVCEICKAKFLVKYNFNRHVCDIAEVESKMYACNFCDKRYVHQRSLNRHLFSHDKRT